MLEKYIKACERWQKENPGKDLVWPDHVDLVIWLSEKIAELEAALHPFAEIPPVILNDSATPPLEAVHYWTIIGAPGKSHFTREDLTMARKALRLDR